MLQLYITTTSPYARLARIMVLEKRLEDRVEIIVAKTRTKDSPYYLINPSGRVPYLRLEDGRGLEDSPLVCAYLDHLDGAPSFQPPAGGEGWEARRLEALARSMVDGLAVWGRELRRPEAEQSPTIIAHEGERACRLADLWETEIANPLMHGPLNMAQMTLISGLDAERRNPDFEWRPGHPGLTAWADKISRHPSVAQTE